jgi:hypothetical protein
MFVKKVPESINMSSLNIQSKWDNSLKRRDGNELLGDLGKRRVAYYDDDDDDEVRKEESDAEKDPDTRIDNRFLTVQIPIGVNPEKVEVNKGVQTPVLEAEGEIIWKPNLHRNGRSRLRMA